MTISDFSEQIARQAQLKEAKKTAERLRNPRKYDPQERAKQLVAEVFNNRVAATWNNHLGENTRMVDPSEVYVVTFAYILGGWKAMVSSDAWDDTSYFEVTHNMAKKETYVDHYRKVSNTCVPDEVME